MLKGQFKRNLEKESVFIVFFLIKKPLHIIELNLVYIFLIAKKDPNTVKWRKLCVCIF